MKRLGTVLGITLLVAALAVPVFAWGEGWIWGHHMMGQWDRGPGYSGQYDRGYGNLTEEQASKLDQLDRKFYSETADLSDKIWSKSAELDTLLSSADPDLEKARALQKEINDLRAKLDEKRLNYELEARKVNPDTQFGRGYGRGYGRHMWGQGPGMGRGRHMGGYGPGACWR